MDLIYGTFVEDPSLKDCLRGLSSTESQGSYLSFICFNLGDKELDFIQFEELKIA